MNVGRAVANFIHVAARPETFRRAGMAFDQVGQVLELAKLTAEQVRALRAEPNLIVRDHPGPDAAPAAGSDAGSDTGKGGKGGKGGAA
ncbi:MAG: hypothetical protein JNM98_06065 [Rhodocyclaceae bacterium]|nr:hypothetical protein [Rhodocyclaceae bacterium]